MLLLVVMWVGVRRGSLASSFRTLDTYVTMIWDFSYIIRTKPPKFQNCVFNDILFVVSLHMQHHSQPDILTSQPAILTFQPPVSQWYHLKEKGEFDTPCFYSKFFKLSLPNISFVFIDIIYAIAVNCHAHLFLQCTLIHLTVTWITVASSSIFTTIPNPLGACNRYP